jgi:uncharacterized protein YqcC (DUF446 family)
MSIYQQCSTLLAQLEQHLKQLDLWGDVIPSSEQLNSIQPFAVDTLTFEQWLQFIFIPKMTLLLKNQASLPITMDIHSMAEESFKGKLTPFSKLLVTIKQLDQLISDHSATTDVK